MSKLVIRGEARRCEGIVRVGCACGSEVVGVAVEVEVAIWLAQLPVDAGCEGGDLDGRTREILYDVPCLEFRRGLIGKQSHRRPLCALCLP